MAKILSPEDLYTYSIALRNSGVTVDNLHLLEMQILVFVFGREGARKLSIEINKNSVTSDKVSELLEGDNILFAGLKPLLAVIVCTNLLSQNRIQVARQNVSKQPLNSRNTNRREESDVVQSLAYTARNIIFAMDDYLRQEGKNPLELKIENTILTTRYSTNTSGTLPANLPYMGFLRW